MTHSKRKAFSLIEVIVSVVLFSVIILSATEIFKMVIDSQRNALATQNVQESLKYFLEVTGKEMRMAQRNKGLCPLVTDPNAIFATSTDSTGNDRLYFKNYYNECVTYALGTDTNGNQRFSITRGNDSDFISPGKIAIDSLHFVLDVPAKSQPIVTINLKAHALNEAQFKAEMTIQTSITSRYYKN